jgi:hypothetical protein
MCLGVEAHEQIFVTAKTVVGLFASFSKLGVPQGGSSLISLFGTITTMNISMRTF